MIRDTRTQTLEALLSALLEEDRAYVGRETTVVVSIDNQAHVRFTLPATKADVDSLIKALVMMKEHLPTTRDRVTLEAVNKALATIGQEPIRGKAP